MLAEDQVETMDFFSLSPEEGDDIPSMPCFECSNVEDRPLAPEADEYPLGCEVELRDKVYAKMAQEESRWEPFLEEIFSVPRRRVKVCRHLGDYTFVLCSDVSGYDLVGFTLYRACLSEPKVKTTKYYANIAARDDDKLLGMPGERFGGRAGDGKNFVDDDVFDRPVDRINLPAPPRAADGISSSNGRAPAAEVKTVNFLQEHERKQQLNLYESNDAPPRRAPAAAAANPDIATAPPVANAPSPDQPAPGGAPLDSNVNSSGMQRMTSSNIGQVRRRSKFATYMKQGTEELERENYEKALECYTAAMREAPEDEARALSSRSVAYLMLKQNDLALKDAERVIELRPDSFLGYLRKANVLRGMKQFIDAQRFYKEAVKRNMESKTIRKLLLGNSVSMLYYARTKRFPKLKMTFDDANTRVLAVARQSIRKDEVVLKESTPIAAVASAEYSQVLVAGSRRTVLCHNCGKLFFDEEALRGHLPGLGPEVFRVLFTDPKRVPCNYGCHAMYCSDECRSKSWAFHHWVECGTRGRWRDGVTAVHAYLDDYIISNTPGLTNDERLKAVNMGDLASSTSPLAIATVIRVAMRMFSRMLSCVWSLRDAVHMFDWLRIAPAVEAQREEVREVLQTSYRLLSESFCTDDKAKLTFDVFERCYMRAKSNIIAMQLSSWNRVAIRAEGLLNFGDADAPALALGRPAPREPTSGGVSHRNASATESAVSRGSAGSSGPAGFPLTEDQRRALRYLLTAPPQGLPGTSHTLFALFEVYAATGAANMSVARQRCPQGPPTGRPSSARERAEAVPDGSNNPSTAPNLAVQQMLEPILCLHVRATRPIQRGEALISAPVSGPVVQSVSRR